MSKEKYLECAVISGTHGVSGMLKLLNYTDSPDILSKIKTLYIKEKNGEFTAKNVIRAFVHKNSVIVLLEGIDSLDSAISFKGKTLYAAREDFLLNEGDFFIADLIGLPVIDHDNGTEYGKISDIMTNRVQDIYVVLKDDGSSFMIPGVKEFIKDVQTEGEHAGVYVKLIEGMVSQ